MADPRVGDGRSRRVFAVIFLICVAVLGFALYLQHVKNLDPCPWCIVQRVAFIVVGVIALIGAVHGPGANGTVVYGGLGGLVAAAGAAAAAYHVWLQSDPVRASACVGSPVERVLDSLALGKLAPDLLQYDGPCTLKPWDLFGMSIPEWSLTWFAVITAMFISVLFRANR